MRSVSIELRGRPGSPTISYRIYPFAPSPWEKYHHGYWLKETLFRRLHKAFDEDAEKQAALKRAYFTGDFKKMSQLMGD